LQEHGTATIFELAAHLGVGDNQISGRFSELEREGLIRKTGERRRKPETTCDAEVYALAAPSTPHVVQDAAALAGYPETLRIENEPFIRQPLTAGETLPCVPYIRHGAGLAQVYRVELIECPGCGHPLKRIDERIANQPRTVYRCGAPACARTWHLAIVSDPTNRPLLALILKTL
jgi:hypothetical protein